MGIEANHCTCHQLGRTDVTRMLICWIDNIGLHQSLNSKLKLYQNANCEISLVVKYSPRLETLSFSRKSE